MRRHLNGWSVVRTCVTALVLAGTFVSSAWAQPGQPSVRFNTDQSILLSYVPQSPIPSGGAFVDATYNGAPIPGTPFFIGSVTTVSSPPLSAGSYTVRVLWPDGSASPVRSFAIGLPEAPTIRLAAADLDTVVLAWDPPNIGPVANYDLEVTIVRTGQVVYATLGSVPDATFRNVPPGLYRLRLRAKNAYGTGPFSLPTADIEVGKIVTGGDLQVSLTWNTTVDLDLHLIEPDGGHVYWGRLIGKSARLDFDDANGFGPENILVPPGFAMPGFYQIYAVHNSQDAETTATIAVTLGANSGNPSTSIFTRRTRRAAPGTAILVATVNVVSGEIVEAVGTSGARTVAATLPVEAKGPPR